MDIVNLDQFKEVVKVTLEDNQYEVTGFTVGDFINTDLEAEVAAAQTPKDKARIIVEKLKQFTNIPEDILMRQQFAVLNALIAVAQGIDPSKQAENDDSKK